VTQPQSCLVRGRVTVKGVGPLEPSSDATRPQETGVKLQVAIASRRACSAVSRYDFIGAGLPSCACSGPLFLHSRAVRCTLADGESPEGAGTRIAARRAWIAESRGLGDSMQVPESLFSTGWHDWSNSQCARPARGPKGRPQAVGGPFAHHARCRLTNQQR
jgi:hypothetical protein